ncbi:MAG: anti-sigma factor [Verrucomicrobiota bacterium]
MDREEAKNLLELCRPGIDADRQDPLIAGAFAMLDNDPELKAWFEAEQAIDARISHSLNRIEPPKELKAEILAGMRAHQPPSATEATNEDTIPFPSQPNSRNWMSALVGIAAIIVVLFVTVSVIRTEKAPSPNPTFATAGVPNLVHFLSDQMDNMKGLDMVGKESGPLMTYLASNGAPKPENLAQTLYDKKTLGCVIFDYNGAKLSMICFNDEAYYHIATIDKVNITEELPSEPAFYQIGPKTFKLWQDDEQVHILTMKGTRDDLPELI